MLGNKARTTIDTKRSGSDKRSTETRLHAGNERRSGTDRRDFPYALKLKTAGSVSMMEEWLDDHAHEEHHLAIVGMSDDLKTKEVLIGFSRPELRDAFKEYYRAKSQ